jgi:hypothetical protein
MEPVVVQVEVCPLLSPELTPAKCRGGGSGHHNLDSLWYFLNGPLLDLRVTCQIGLKSF